MRNFTCTYYDKICFIIDTHLYMLTQDFCSLNLWIYTRGIHTLIPISIHSNHLHISVCNRIQPVTAIVSSHLFLCVSSVSKYFSGGIFQAPTPRYFSRRVNNATCNIIMQHIYVNMWHLCWPYYLCYHATLKCCMST